MIQTLRSYPMRVLILGDLHGRHAALPDILRNAARLHGVTACIQVGDFGFDAACMASLPRLPIPTCAIDGNHDDHAYLAKAKRGRLVRRWQRDLNLRFIERGSLIDLAGVRFGFMGGALNAHAPQAEPANFPTDQDVRTALRSWNRTPPTVIISHSCPAGIGVGMAADPSMASSVQHYCRDAGHDPGPDDDCGEPGLTALWHGLHHKPRLWCFGHFHTLHDRTVDGVRFVCVGSGDGTDGAPLVRPVVLDIGDPAALAPEIVTDPACGL
jgi:predicted phosphodiesterase